MPSSSNKQHRRKTVIVTLKGQPRTLRPKNHPPITIRELKWRGHRQVEIEGLEIEGFGQPSVDMPEPPT